MAAADEYGETRSPPSPSPLVSSQGHRVIPSSLSNSPFLQQLPPPSKSGSFCGGASTPSGLSHESSPVPSRPLLARSSPVIMVPPPSSGIALSRPGQGQGQGTRQPLLVGSADSSGSSLSSSSAAGSQSASPLLPGRPANRPPQPSASGPGGVARGALGMGPAPRTVAPTPGHVIPAAPANTPPRTRGGVDDEYGENLRQPPTQGGVAPAAGRAVGVLARSLARAPPPRMPAPQPPSGMNGQGEGEGVTTGARLRMSNSGQGQPPPLPSKGITIPGINLGERGSGIGSLPGKIMPHTSGLISPTRGLQMSPTAGAVRVTTMTKSSSTVELPSSAQQRGLLFASMDSPSASVSNSPAASSWRGGSGVPSPKPISRSGSTEDAFEVAKKMSMHRRPTQAAPPSEENALSALTAADSGLVTEVSKVLCECMVAEIKKGIKLQKLPDFSEALCRVGHPPGDPSPSAMELVVSPSETAIFEPVRCPLRDISSVSESRTPDGKTVITVTFRNCMTLPPLSFQSKDRAANVNFVDGLGSLIGQPLLTKERISDVLVIKEVFDLTHLYGRPAVPPLPQSL